MNPRHSQAPAQFDSLEMQSSLSGSDSQLHSAGDYVSLIVRMWYTYGIEAGISEGNWHVEVEHIQSGGHWDFFTVNELERFLIDFLDKMRKNNQV